MANTFILGGSPLGLIGVQSRPTRDGMSTFNGGKSRNVNVLAYNTGRAQETNIRDDKGRVLKSGVSLFTGGSIPNFWPNIGKIGSDGDSLTEKNSSINRDTLHNNDVYDTSVLNIIEKLSQCPKASLRPQDFAYLKELGVYPNNRLMIARKFASPQKDNILDKQGSTPLATIISWKKPDEDFLTITYGEEWDDAEADFTGVLNKLGENFGIGGKGSSLPGIGDMAGGGFGALPLPGFTETLQREFLSSIGILQKNAAGVEVLPAGNPNLIKKAKQRRLVPYGKADSGLMCRVQVKMEAVYEQKFISGIDPTIAYMDILNNLVHFGTQKSDNYGLSKTFENKLNRWTKDPGLLINDLIESLSDSFEKITTIIKDVFKREEEKLEKKEEKAKDLEEKKKDLEKKKEDSLIDAEGLANTIKKSLKDTVKKYRIQIMGIANALSGSPSTPWHITIGNPLRPVFCSGDMYTDSVQLELGKDLAFNDLPSTIKVSFTLENARPWGLQEILAKFNTGHIRTVNVRQDFSVTDAAGKSYGLRFEDDEFVEKEFDAERDNRQGQSSDGTTRTNPIGFEQTTKVNSEAGAKQNEQ